MMNNGDRDDLVDRTFMLLEKMGVPRDVLVNNREGIIKAGKEYLEEKPHDYNTVNELLTRERIINGPPCPESVTKTMEEVFLNH